MDPFKYKKGSGIGALTEYRRNKRKRNPRPPGGLAASSGCAGEGPHSGRRNAGEGGRNRRDIPGRRNAGERRPRLSDAAKASRGVLRYVSEAWSDQMDGEGASQPVDQFRRPEGRRNYSTSYSQSLYSSSLPAAMAKKRSWMALVIGPRPPISRPSTDATGVTSAAEPVKNTSSAA